MPFLTVISSRKKLLGDVISNSISPLRLIGLAFVLGSLSPLLVIPWQSTTDIFSWIEIPIIANVGFIAFNERKLLSQMSRWQWIHWVATMSLGVISIEFTGIFAHTATIFMQDHSAAVFWDHVSLTLFGGSFGLSIFQSYTKRLIGRKFDDRTNMLFVILLVVLLVVISWIAFPKLIPLIVQGFSHIS